MGKSKLERYIDILQTLVSQGPIRLTQLMHKTALSQSMLRGHLDFLMQQDLVEKQSLGKNRIYVITDRGFRVLKVVAPIIEEAQRIQASTITS